MENNNEDLSVEEILSSIKDILEEDVEKKGEFNPDSVVEEDDIIELSESQIIADPTDLGDDDISELPAMAENTVDVESEPVFEESFSDFVVPSPQDFALEPEVVNEPELASEPDLENISDELEKILGGSFDEPSVQEIESQLEVESEIEIEPEVKIEIEPEIEPIPQPIFEPKPEPKEDKEDAVDTSAEIISNFAKMFSAAKVEPVEEEKPVTDYAPATHTGDLSKTLEDMVLELMAKKVDGINFNSLANFEVKLWLNQNLQAIVERVVKQELEMVMKKAGQ